MPDPNPNRSLPPEQVEALVSQRLPHLAAGLGADRTWVWWSGEKPADGDRKALIEIGFSFTPRPHALPDGRSAHWFHPCGGAVIRRRKGEKKSGQVSTRQQSTAESSGNTDLQAQLSRLADLL